MFADVATSGPLVAAIAVSALAGLVSFASPCVLPLIPGYLSYVTGLAGEDVAGSETERRFRLRSLLPSRVVVGSSLFVLGFAVVFTLLGAAFGGAGRWLLEYQASIEKVVGVVVILLGIMFLGLVPGFYREFRIRWLPSPGVWGAPLLGAVFALGWTPCLGPTLAAVQGLAFVEGSATRGATLLLAYALGLGIPFVVCALGFRWVTSAVVWLRRHAVWVRNTGGVLLILVGALLVTGYWNDVVIWLRGWAGIGEIGI